MVCGLLVNTAPLPLLPALKHLDFALLTSVLFPVGQLSWAHLLELPRALCLPPPQPGLQKFP